jgi:N-acetylglucosaminyldiphosphoundecaprenol N-acetyl-beta-D-mannosaminyltransferase
VRIDLLGVGLDAADPGQIKGTLERWIADAAGRCVHVVTLNPEYVELARRDDVFRAAVKSADLVTADGIGVLVAARLLGGRRATGLRRVTGLDLCEWLADVCADQDASLFLLGGRAGAAADAALTLTGRRANLQIAGTWEGGSPDAVDDTASLTMIAATGARALLVAYGAPGQVSWIARNQSELARVGVRLAIGVGGAFDVISGRVPRAPSVLRRLGLEWLYRLVREPWRWRRQLALPRFAGHLVGEVIRRRLSRVSPGPVRSTKR